MTRLTVQDGQGGFNMDTVRLSDLNNAVITEASSSIVRASVPSAGRPSDAFFIAYGAGLFVDDDPPTVMGTLNRLEFRVPGMGTVTLTNFSETLLQFLLWQGANDANGMFSTLLSGSDYLLGSLTSGADLLRGFGGNDTIDAGGGADTVYGGLGDDVINGGAAGLTDSPNFLRGEEGNDSLRGGTAFDDMHGNQGVDTLAGGDGGDWVVGGQSGDLLYGDSFIPSEDSFSRFGGDDLVYGNLGDDTCIGGIGADIVRGGQGNDTMAGGSGGDWMSGDRGDDTMTGGAGADIFNTFGEAGIDRVLDFSAVTEGDRVRFEPGTQFTTVQVGADTVINMTGGGQMILVGVQLSSLPPGWFSVG